MSLSVVVGAARLFTCEDKNNAACLDDVSRNEGLGFGGCDGSVDERVVLGLEVLQDEITVGLADTEVAAT